MAKSKKKNKRHGFISMRLHTKLFTQPPIPIGLPGGCIGVAFAFKDKKSAIEWDGREYPLVEIEEVK